MAMDWNPDSARNAYLDTLKLCGIDREKQTGISQTTSEPENKEFISALAAGMNAKVIVEVAPEASLSTIALAAAARQTGGKLLCIVPEPMLNESQKVIDNSGLNNMVEFKTGNPGDLLTNCKNIDFSLVDRKSESYNDALEVLQVNEAKAVVVADKGVRRARKVQSMRLLKEKVKEVTTAGKNEEIERRSPRLLHRHSRSRSWGDLKNHSTSKWVTKIDAVSGEQHIFRITK